MSEIKEACGMAVSRTDKERGNVCFHKDLGPACRSRDFPQRRAMGLRAVFPSPLLSIRTVTQAELLLNPVRRSRRIFPRWRRDYPCVKPALTGCILWTAVGRRVSKLFSFVIKTTFQVFKQPFRNRRKHLIFFPDQIYIRFKSWRKRTECKSAVLACVNKMFKCQKIPQPLFDKKGTIIG